MHLSVCVAYIFNREQRVCVFVLLIDTHARLPRPRDCFLWWVTGDGRFAQMLLSKIGPITPHVTNYINACVCECVSVCTAVSAPSLGPCWKSKRSALTHAWTHAVLRTYYYVHIYCECQMSASIWTRTMLGPCRH